eukprot:scaffold32285_cov130-Isochrysis_galbana.AAC.2
MGEGRGSVRTARMAKGQRCPAVSPLKEWRWRKPRMRHVSERTRARAREGSRGCSGRRQRGGSRASSERALTVHRVWGYVAIYQFRNMCSSLLMYF